ncbi:MAG TPA: DUF3224 domain-containing protein [Thermoanaerobaculia bacterium]|nr:DUF3224 domain-containing protein [Thermoanaerobaculia bacterium]
MTTRTPTLAAAIACWLAVTATPGTAAAHEPSPEGREGSAMPTFARGTFDVKLERVAEEPFPGGNALGRYSLNKQYHGDLEAEAAGEMLTAGTPVEGSAAYVAIERVEGTLHGRRGSFLLQHRGTMGHGEQRLEITVVPDSGTGELVGLAGSLEVIIAGGEHSYILELTLPE